MFKYEHDPLKIRDRSFQIIREQVSLDHLNDIEQQIALWMIYTSGDLSLINNLKFSDMAAKSGFEKLEEDFELLCDTEMAVACLNQKYLDHEPICLVNKANVISQAKAEKKTRSMVAVDLWDKYLPGSVVIIGDEATSLLRLLEQLENSDDEDNKPDLVIATPLGFTDAAEGKQYLWEHHEKLGVECITVLGTGGGSTIAATVMNALFNVKQGKYF